MTEHESAVLYRAFGWIPFSSFLSGNAASADVAVFNNFDLPTGLAQVEQGAQQLQA
jgi:hypothetical protein